MSTHNGYVKEFPFIRIDSFTSLSNPSNGLHPLYYFLTHAHTDHLSGLSSPSFRGTIYMTPITKMIVGNSIEASERVRWQEFRGGETSSSLIKRPKKKFENLLRPTTTGGRRESKVCSIGTSTKSRGMDQIKEINLNQPIKLDGANVGDYVKVTAIDANHCPGSCMFLFEGMVDGSFRSCLVTGDLRAEPWYIDQLLHNPLLAPYTILPPTNTNNNTTSGKAKGKGKEREIEQAPPTRELDCIYLDTSNVLLNEELVEKAVAISELIRMIQFYPPTTKFFINCWTWGYEELLKTIYKTFRGTEPIHLDWYKYKIYTSNQIKQFDPLLSTLGTLSTSSNPSEPEPPSPSLHLPSSSEETKSNSSTQSTGGVRFHACERYWKCDQVWQDGRGCYTFPEEFLQLQQQQQQGEDDEAKLRSRNDCCRGRGKEEKKRLVRPGSGEYLKRDGTIGVRGEGEEEDEDEGEEGLVVWVNPVEMMKWNWEEYKVSTWDKIRRAKQEEEEEEDFVVRGKKRGKSEKDTTGFPKSLLVPLARHSTLPELQRFVSIFRPKTLYPLTISTNQNTRQHPAREYLSMPGLFEGMLAKGGEERLKREAREYVKNLQKGQTTAKVVTSSPDDDGEGKRIEGDRWFGHEERGGKWEEEMKKRGLNVEGGKDVVEEVLEWSDRVNTRDEVPRNGGVRDMEIDQVESLEDVVTPQVPSTSIAALYEPTTTIELGNRRLRYGDPPSQSIESNPQVPILIPSTSSALLPSALPPPLSTRPVTPTPKPPLRPSAASTTTITTRTLRKSVTFAPSPTKSPELLLSTRKGSSVVPLKRSRSLPIPPPPPSPIRASSNPHSPAHRPVPSTSTATSHILNKPINSENIFPSSSSSRPLSNPISKSKPKPKQSSILASLSKDGTQRARLLLSLQRTLQGKIGPNGTIIPFSDRERAELKKRERRFREQEKGKGKAREAAEVETGETGFEEQGMEEIETYESSQQFETVSSSY